jgi:hypothetical protein
MRKSRIPHPVGRGRFLPYAVLTLLLSPWVRVSNAFPRPEDTVAQRAELAKALAQPDEGDRQKAIDAVVASPRAALPWLLEWSHCGRIHRKWVCSHPPPEAGIFPDNLVSSMAEIFGRLRIREAIPFLVREIDVETFKLRPRGSLPRNAGSPPIKALIEIGKEATPDLLRRFAEVKTCDAEDCRMSRLAVVIALANIADPRARVALEQAAKWPAPDGAIAADGLRNLSRSQ